MSASTWRVLRCRIPGGGDRFWTVFGQVLGRFETVQSFKNAIDAHETDGKEREIVWMGFVCCGRAGRERSWDFLHFLYGASPLGACD